MRAKRCMAGVCDTSYATVASEETAVLTTKPRAKHLGPERRRPLVLDAALELFVDHGYAATSMESIAVAAGVTKPVVYECYPGKQALFRALLEREEARLLSAIEAALPEVGAFAEAESAITASYTAVLRAAEEAPSSWRVVFISEHGSDPAVTARVTQGRRRVVERLGRLIEPYLVGRGVDEAERKAPVAAEVLVAIGEAGVRFGLEHPGEWAPEELGALLGRLVMRGPDI